jgi:hypothetical protein
MIQNQVIYLKRLLEKRIVSATIYRPLIETKGMQHNNLDKDLNFEGKIKGKNDNFFQ